MFLGETTTETIRLRGEDIPAVVGFVRHQDLRFYPENPRIYSMVYAGGKEPTQDEILDKLRGMEHVKQLVQSIKSNDGLHDPIIVRNNIVLEGNSRLAAYRLLSESDPIKWGFIKSKVLPAETSESLVFALLGEYHLVGKKDWAPYEQAGYLYRRHFIHKVEKSQIAIESGLRSASVSHYINVYKFMVDNEQNEISKWSYYDEYLKSRYVKKVRDEYPDFDDVVISKINSGEISKAADIRDKLKIIVQSNKKNIKKFISGERDFDMAYLSASDQGLTLNLLKRVNAFRGYISDLDTEKGLLELDSAMQDKCLFEFKKISKKLEHLTKKITG